MFEKRTVFVVGAGASREVGFPMGVELTKTIAKKLHIGSKGGWQIDFGDRKIVSAVEHAKREEHDRNCYWQAGRAIAAGMPQAISIDNFLHTHADDQIVTWMGKLGIAASILEAETASKLAPSRERDHVDVSSVSDSWFNIFFQMLSEGVQVKSLDRLLENIAFITFNYDRCIEHYLVHAIENYFRVDAGRAQSLASTLRIIHPYGQVGRLPWQSPRGNTGFGKDFYPQDLPLISNQIRTFTEQVEDQDMVNEAKNLIGRAEVLVFLGFSYGNMNMDFLSTENVAYKSIFGTTLGVSTANSNAIQRLVTEKIGRGRAKIRQASFDALTCHDFLRDYWRPIVGGF